MSAKREFLWLAVTPDVYELPLAVCDTADELGQKYGLSGNTVISNIKRKADGTKAGRKFVRVRLEE